MRTLFSWLENEVPLWVKDGIINEQNAKILLDRYRVKILKTPLIALVIFGSLLIGLGIISIFAYNWEELSRGFKTFIAVTFLVLAQCVAFLAKRYKPDSLGASEGASLFWFLAFGCSLAIIAQVYNLGGEFRDFLYVWAIFTLPIVYLFNSRSTAFFIFIIIIYLININAFDKIFSYSNESGVLPNIELLLLWLPFYVLHLKNNLRANSTVFLNLIFIMGMFITMCGEISLSSTYDMLAVYAAVFCAIFWLLGTLLYDEYEKFYKRVFELLAKFGAFVLLVVFCNFNDLSKLQTYLEHTNLLYLLTAIFVILFVLFCIYRRNKFYELLIPLSPIAIYLLFSYGISTILFNVFIIIGSLAMIIGGAKKSSMALANQGLILISLLIVIHFFDSDFALLAKGLCFILIGSSFIALNLILRKYIKDNG